MTWPEALLCAVAIIAFASVIITAIRTPSTPTPRRTPIETIPLYKYMSAVPARCTSHDGVFLMTNPTVCTKAAAAGGGMCTTPKDT